MKKSKFTNYAENRHKDINKSSEPITEKTESKEYAAPVVADKTKSIVLPIRFDPNTYSQIRNASRKAGYISISTYCRAMIIKELDTKDE